MEDSFHKTEFLVQLEHQVMLNLLQLREGALHHRRGDSPRCRELSVDHAGDGQRARCGARGSEFVNARNPEGARCRRTSRERRTPLSQDHL